MMSNYVLLIERQNGVSLEDVEKYLKTEFRSEDYIMGFLDGYLFDKYRILTLKEYESRVHSHSPSLNDKWLKFVSVTRKVEDE
jgi:hypothetical protein